MSHRERFLTAIDLGEPDLVPITDLGLDPPIIEAIIGRKIGKSGFSLIGGATWQASVQNRIALTEACLKLGFDAVPALSDYTLASYAYQPKALPEKRFIDEWGRIMEPRAETKTTWWIGGTVETEEQIKSYTPPDPEAEGRAEMVKKLVETLKGKDTVVMGQIHSGWHMAFQIRGGIDKLLLDMYRRSELAHEFMAKIAETCLGMAKQMVEGGVEVLFVTDDYADCRSPFMTMEQFREFELPNMHRLIDYAKRKGIPVLKHTDGNIYPILDDMVDVGIKGIHPIEPGTMDLKNVKERYGSKICILGNVDCRQVLPFGSEHDVRRDVRRCIDAAAKGGGYVLTSSNSIHANCKPENIHTMVEEARRYGKYPL